ncbi:hypothetical protein HR45_16800 [Shewanella mangrovi]|uniref:Uncharacterized protein n=1 Tax=Shewanella mangrovi TaxID=1515746 RepID=A0A094JAS4_9GAMM|nr:hypothetical protein [Shewanella mangrovi]KFZ36317.1 hypothetical protein HR45_16800 [Shewanella mangrovi]
MGLETIYAMQALPPPNQYKSKRDVKQVSDSAEVAPEHENEQKAITPHLQERRKRVERRKAQRPFARERRKGNRRQPQNREPEQSAASSDSGAIIDITV